MLRIHNVISIMGPDTSNAMHHLNSYSRQEEKRSILKCIAKYPQIQCRASCRFENAMKQQNELTYLRQDFALRCITILETRSL